MYFTLNLPFLPCEIYFTKTLVYSTVEPSYNTVVRIHSGDCVIDETHYSKVLPEPYFILGPDNADHVCNKMDMLFVVICTENYRVTTDCTF